MEGLDFWRLCDELTVVQAALLMLGRDPSGAEANVESWKMPERPNGYEAVKTALTSALRRGDIKGKSEPIYEFDSYGNECGVYENSTNPDSSVLDVESLIVWLARRGFRSDFFSRSEPQAPDYLDPNHPRYAPKLAAAVKVWLAMEDENLLRGKGTVAAMERWLESRYRELGLVHDRDNPKNGTSAGDMNRSAISEAAKVANWQAGGGAPKTLG